MQRQRWKKLAVAAVATGLVAAVCGCGIIETAYDVISGKSDKDTTTVLDENQDDRYADIEEKLEQLDKIIGQYYLNEDDIDPEALEESLLKGYIEGLNEDYSVYYTAEEFADLMEETSGEYEGVGMMVSQQMDTMQITVIKVFEGGPADEAGMKAGDILYKVEGEEIGDKEVSFVVKDIKGEAGTWVNVTVYRPSTGEYIDLKMERRNIETPTVEHTMLEDNIGYISISSFESVTSKQFGEAIEDLQNQSMEGLIIDLRNNPGGMLTTVCEMLDRVLPEGQLLVYTIDKNGTKEETLSEDSDTLDLPMAVLVNGQSASASEIFTAAMQDYDKAVIVGETTFGKGIVQVIIPLSDGSAVKLTTSKYYTPNGECIHEIGVTPDIEVELDLEGDTDNQLEAAVEAVKAQLQ